MMISLMITHVIIVDRAGVVLIVTVVSLPVITVISIINYWAARRCGATCAYNPSPAPPVIAPLNLPVFCNVEVLWSNKA